MPSEIEIDLALGILAGFAAIIAIIATGAAIAALTWVVHLRGSKARRRGK